MQKSIEEHWKRLLHQNVYGKWISLTTIILDIFIKIYSDKLEMVGKYQMKGSM